MNLIITKRCNKGCPYCFAAASRNDTRPDDWDMSFETFCELLDKIKDGDVPKLLGGEPTQHPEFKRFVDEVIRRELNLTVISNFLFEDDITEFLIEKLHKQKIGFLINSTNLDAVKGREELFVSNYNKIYNFLYEHDGEEVMSCGFTFEDDKSYEFYVDALTQLKEKLSGIERLRLSIANPSTEKENFFFINNHDIGKKFIHVIRKCLQLGITPSLDCIIYPCMFSNKEEWKYIKKFLSNVRTKCEGCPNDIFPDKTASFCYPTKEYLKVDTTKYESIKEIKVDLEMRHKILTNKQTLPDECSECQFKEVGMCSGPCLAFYNLESETLGINT